VAKLIRYFEVGTDPQDGQQFCLLTLSGARQLAESLAEAVELMSEGLFRKLEYDCGQVRVVFVTDETLGRIMDQAKRSVGLPADYEAFTEVNGDSLITEIPDWLMRLGMGGDIDEDIENLKRILGDGAQDALEGPQHTDSDPED
jgi:hypothetical protein